MFNVVSKGDVVVALYPAYFDSSRSREDGRRVSRSVAVAGPTAEELRDVAKKLGFRVEVEPEVAHPSRPHKPEGRVLILGGGKKTEIVRAVAQKLKSQRS